MKLNLAAKLKNLSSLSKKKVSPKLFFVVVTGIFLLSLALVGLKLQSNSSKIKTAKLSAINASDAVKVPYIQTKTTQTTKPVPFTSSTINSSSLAKGTTKVTTVGVNGVETITYKNTYTDGKLTSTKQVSDTVTTQPINQVTSVGSYVAPVKKASPVVQAPANLTPSISISSDGCTVTATGTEGDDLRIDVYNNAKGGGQDYTLPASGTDTESSGGIDGMTVDVKLKNASGTILLEKFGTITENQCW